ncbi:uncharacterized protein LOC110063821 isoform X2 [Orbicella faveolata]|uniref:uncharacterized protein LOC110063821 isoform X2 n=1 Tax=Orbicella faveolata TaxID=48498 RepID=UPI0009E25048|nr:uncharacterized protein LOC110063821 isoform X2 [Orbicella faveolata]
MGRDTRYICPNLYYASTFRDVTRYHHATQSATQPHASIACDINLMREQRHLFPLTLCIKMLSSTLCLASLLLFFPELASSLDCSSNSQDPSYKPFPQNVTPVEFHTRMEISLKHRNVTYFVDERYDADKERGTFTLIADKYDFETYYDKSKNEIANLFLDDCKSFTWTQARYDRYRCRFPPSESSLKLIGDACSATVVLDLVYRNKTQNARYLGRKTVRNIPVQGWRICKNETAMDYWFSVNGWLHTSGNTPAPVVVEARPQSAEYYDLDKQLYRVDYNGRPNRPSSNEPGVAIRDMENRNSTFYNRKTGSCQEIVLESVKPTLIAGKYHFRINTPFGKMQLFEDQDAKPVYQGKATARGIKCDVWRQTRVNWPGEYKSRMIWRWYFTQSPQQPVPVRLEIEGNITINATAEDEFESNVNFYLFEWRYPSPDAFSVSSLCPKEPTTQKQTRLSSGAVAGVAIACVVLGLLVGVLLVYIAYKRMSAARMGPPPVRFP